MHIKYTFTCLQSHFLTELNWQHWKAFTTLDSQHDISYRNKSTRAERIQIILTHSNVRVNNITWICWYYNILYTLKHRWQSTTITKEAWHACSYTYKSIRDNNCKIGGFLHCIHPFSHVFLKGSSKREERERKGGGELTHTMLTAISKMLSWAGIWITIVTQWNKHKHTSHMDNTNGNRNKSRLTAVGES